MTNRRARLAAFLVDEQWHSSIAERMMLISARIERRFGGAGLVITCHSVVDWARSGIFLRKSGWSDGGESNRWSFEQVAKRAGCKVSGLIEEIEKIEKLRKEMQIFQSENNAVFLHSFVVGKPMRRSAPPAGLASFRLPIQKVWTNFLHLKTPKCKSSEQIQTQFVDLNQN